jgi:hypothetical protein
MQQISLIHDLLLAFMQSKNAAMPCQRAPGSLDSPPWPPSEQQQRSAASGGRACLIYSDVCLLRYRRYPSTAIATAPWWNYRRARCGCGGGSSVVCGHSSRE